ncbi:unnamed protein product [Ilex paraguariensis]|uniref:Uncharacterized protein n=1 Tax=Ilex paraguariensis TaxID=185542 RepID=A0ABC8UG14_9AQUA
MSLEPSHQILNEDKEGKKNTYTSTMAGKNAIMIPEENVELSFRYQLLNIPFHLILMIYIEAGKQAAMLTTKLCTVFMVIYLGYSWQLIRVCYMHNIHGGTS